MELRGVRCSGVSNVQRFNLERRYRQVSVVIRTTQGCQIRTRGSIVSCMLSVHFRLVHTLPAYSLVPRPPVPNLSLAVQAWERD